MIELAELVDWINEQIESERRQLKTIINVNSSGAGMMIGAHDAYCHVLDFIEGRLDD